MKNKYFFTLLAILISTRLFSQEIRVNNSFIVTINNKLTTNISAVQLILADNFGKENKINASYIPGELFVDNYEKSKILHQDTFSTLYLAFNNFEYRGKRQFIHNYRIEINRQWFKSSYIILRITDQNKDKYKYSFEVPGHSFGK